jgi:hypothetical protein
LPPMANTEVNQSNANMNTVFEGKGEIKGVFTKESLMKRHSKLG